MAHAHAANPSEFNELDPHGAGGHGQHESHVIVGPFTLRLILAILLFFTATTVGLAQLEIWIAGFFDITLPLWLNIVIAMSIATVKAVLVMAYFMQLRYDNPINTILMGFCIFGVLLFICFTAMDLLTRDRIYDFKEGQVVAGGTFQGNLSRVDVARQEFIERVGEDRYKEIKAAIKHDAHGHGHGDSAVVGSTASKSRPIVGTTDALSTEPAHHDGGHGDGHGNHKAGSGEGHSAGDGH